jgi:hypothetical protein
MSDMYACHVTSIFSCAKMVLLSDTTNAVIYGGTVGTVFGYGLDHRGVAVSVPTILLFSGYQGLFPLC